MLRRGTAAAHRRLQADVRRRVAAALAVAFAGLEITAHSQCLFEILMLASTAQRKMKTNLFALAGRQGRSTSRRHRGQFAKSPCKSWMVRCRETAAQIRGDLVSDRTDPHAAIGHFGDEAVSWSVIVGDHCSEILDALTPRTASFLTHTAGLPTCRPGRRSATTRLYDEVCRRLMTTPGVGPVARKSSARLSISCGYP
jgi:hypothetical protein